MKAREGFVSNSSTTSFSIYGICLGFDEFLDVVRTPAFATLVPPEALPSLEQYTKEYGDSAPYEFITSVLDEVMVRAGGMLVESDWDGEQVYIGREYSSIADDETGGDLKRSVEDKFRPVFPNASFGKIDTTIAS